MFESYFLPIIIFVSLGLLSGILLAVVSAVFAVNEDKLTADIRECLPGANCGACGYSGCDSYAKAVAENSEKPNLCIPGGETVAASLAKLTGAQKTDFVPLTAVVKCTASSDILYEYNGDPTCAAAGNFYGGNLKCASGCLGFGDCAAVCNYDAVCIKGSCAFIDSDKCVGCGACVKACPKNIIELLPKDNGAVVLCSSSDTAKATHEACDKGCIGCKKCEKVCEYEAIKVKDNHAVIDFEKCVGCGKCADNCPVGCIAIKA